MNSFREVRRISVRFAALGCVALLLLVTTVAAAHSCDLANYGGSQLKTSAAITPDHGPCLICAAAHSPSVVAPFLPLSPKLITAPLTAPKLAIQTPSSPAFALHVRPPPAA